MILKGLREKSNKKYLNKLLSQRQVNVSEKPIKSLGVILNLDEFNYFEAFQDFADTLKVHPNNVKILGFTENVKDGLNSWDLCFTPEDIGWKGAIKNDELKTFLNKNFDVLISFYEKDVLELKILTAVCKANMKIGVFQEDERLNDLIVKTSLKELKVFKKEVFKYLTKLNKIENEE